MRAERIGSLDVMDDVSNNLDETVQQRLFQPGSYMSIPYVIAARVDLSAAAKLVWAALAKHLGPNATEVYPGISTLMRMTGTSKDTVMRASASLVEAGLVSVRKVQGRNGLHNVYRLYQPEIDPSQNATGGKLRPVAKCGATGRKMPPTPVAKCDLNYLSEIPKGSKTPLTPRTAGGSQSDLDIARIAAALNAAHEAVFGAPMPRRWERRLERLDGTAVMFDGVTVADVRAAVTRAKEKRKTFGFGWVEDVLREKASASVAAKESKAANARTAEAEARKAKDAEAKRQEAKQQAQERSEHFATLGADRQADYRRLATQGRFASKRPDVIEAFAAMLAWKDFEKGGNA